jgi:predicted GH43/DUF377 family glycosyl hydrolase
MFKWNKKGLIFSVNGQYPWMHSHAQCPFTIEFDDFVRVYFSTREDYSNNMSRAFGGFVDLDKNDLKKVLRVSDKPLMELGGIGEFDEFGSMPNSVIKHNNEYYLYYCGWTRGFSTPYSWEIGLAKSLDSKNFIKVGKGPLIGPTLYEPYLHACPVVYKFAEEDLHMFYLSGVRWLKDKEKTESQYLLMHATSTDGVNWERNVVPVIEPKVEYECQTSAAIIKIEDEFHMFFSYRHGLDFRKDRNKGYRIGYASSNDMKTWIRDDSKAGIDVSETGWDSEMIGYPHIAKINGKYIMFYCGNHFGKDGFGYAELEEIANNE